MGVCLVGLCLAGVGMLGPQSANAQIYVDAGASGAEDGTSWSDAYTSLQDALDEANGTDEIWIAEGTYTPTRQLDSGNPRTATFEVTGAQDGLKIYGGFDGTETSRSERDLSANETILSGDIDGDGTPTDNAYHVVVFNGGEIIGTESTENITPNTVLDGVTITGGNADAGGFNTTDQTGGGLYCDGGSSGFGGDNACSPEITNVVFAGNTVDLDGGAIYNNGTSGESSPQITNATFIGNTSENNGGAIYNSGGLLSGESRPQITNATFTGNSARLSGGAIYNSGDDSDPQITNTILWENTAEGAGNQIYNDNNATPTLTHTLIEGGLPSGTNDGGGNVDTDPLFVDGGTPAGPDGIFGTEDDGLRLTSGSPALDAGTNAPFESGGVAETVTTDLLGEARIQNSTVSLGAYERGIYAGPIYHVDAGATTGQNDGSSFNNAFTDLQDALSMAQGNDVIVIAAGTYTPSARLDASDPRTATFEVTGEQDGLKIYGGWTGTETFTDISDVEAALSSRDLSANETTLSGDIDGDGTSTDNAYHVVVFNGGNQIGDNSTDNITPDTGLDGVTITGGNANGSGLPNDAGGGLYCDGVESTNACSPTLTRLTFTGNSANFGGAIYNGGFNNGTSSPQITSATFTGNSAQEGGAIYNAGFNNSTSSPVVTNATFTGNSASNSGGAIYFSGDSGSIAARVTNSLFANNGAHHIGFDDGNAGEQPRFVNSTFTGATDFAFDVPFYNSGQTPIEVINSVLWDNGSGGIAGTSGSVTDPDAAVAVTFSIVEEARYAAGSGDANAGPGNINQDPLFVDASDPVGPDGTFGTADDGLRLAGGSPAIARGTYAPFETGGIAEDVTTDLAGDARRFGLFPDLGAYELSTIAATSDQITGATGLVGYVEPTGFGGLLLLRDAASGDLTFTRTEEAPESPDLPENVAPVTWTVNASLSAAPTYDLVVDVSSLGGIGDFSALMLYKSEDGGQTWDAVTNLGGTLVQDEDRALVAVQDLTGFSQFAIASTDANNPLPVELAGFDARRSGNDAITVQWQTLSETGNAGFEVQRAATSADGPANASVETSQVETSQWGVSTGKSWQTIAHLEGAGTTDEPQSYQFEDTDLPYAADSLSYRLRQIDADGTESFSEAVTIARQVTDAELLPTYPNPVHGQATVRFAVPEQQDVRIHLYDVLGRRVQTVVDTNAEGRTEAQLDVSDLASGTYFLRMQTEAGPVDTQRVTVVR